MKKKMTILLAPLALATQSFALGVGDVAYTCHHQSYWVPPVSYYQPCEVIVTQVLGSRYRVERTRDCMGAYAGESFISDSSHLFWGSDIIRVNKGYGEYGPGCDPDLF